MPEINNTLIQFENSSCFKITTNVNNNRISRFIWIQWLQIINIWFYCNKTAPFLFFFCGVLYKTIGKGVHFCMYISIIDAETFVW